MYFIYKIIKNITYLSEIKHIIHYFMNKQVKMINPFLKLHRFLCSFFFLRSTFKRRSGKLESSMKSIQDIQIFGFLIG